MKEPIKRQIDLKLSQDESFLSKAEKAQLSINKDTAYNIYYNSYDSGDEQFLYLKLEENTADAPFFYHRTYDINELHLLHKIFKSDDDVFQVKDDLKSMFKCNKIKISFQNANEDIIEMHLDVMNFAQNYIINFDLYKEMIPEGKDDKLISLYDLTKSKLKLIKEIKFLLNNSKGNKDDNKIIEELKKIINSKEIPGLEKENIIENQGFRDGHNQNKDEIVIIEKEKIKEDEKLKENQNIQDNIEASEIMSSEIIPEKKNKKYQTKYTILKNRYVFIIGKESYSITLTLKNVTQENWPVGKIELKCDQKETSLCYSNIVYPIYDIGPGEDGDFSINFDKKDIIAGKYLCKLGIFVNGIKLEDSDLPLNIRVK